jgi:hypothetical protein
MGAFDDGDETPTEVTADSAEVTAPAEQPTFYPDMFTWVEGWLLPHWVRPKKNWDDKWWEYPEVLSRFEALWRAWEHLRLDGALGMSVFWRDHLETHMTSITSAEGPFYASRKVGQDGPPNPWPTAPVDRESVRIELQSE